MFTYLDLTKDNIIAFKAEGEITKADYDSLIPLLNKTGREHDAIRLLVEIGDIKGITIRAFLEDVATYFKHIRSIEKIAVIGDSQAEKVWAKLADPFTRTDVKYHPRAEKDLAMEWIER